MSLVLLVRHGQASFGTQDYDRLSALGRDQARRLGESLSAAGVKPDRLLTGGMRRQRDTAQEIASAAGWDLIPDVDPGWDEFDHEELAGPAGRGGDSTAFLAALEAGLRSWPKEELALFRERTTRALHAAVAGTSRGGTTVVVSSGGVISLLAADLAAGSVETWLHLNRVCVNSGITRMVAGRRGLTLVSFNEHAHLDSDQISYR